MKIFYKIIGLLSFIFLLSFIIVKFDMKTDLQIAKDNIENDIKNYTIKQELIHEKDSNILYTYIFIKKDIVYKSNKEANIHNLETFLLQQKTEYNNAFNFLNSYLLIKHSTNDKN